MEYLVDIIMPAYNHEKYIGQALESIATQKTNFAFRVIVSDDCSKDNTRAVIAQYAAKYPDIVFPIFQEKNLGAIGNGYFLVNSVRAKYFAICDGDDYWIDPLKLQKQVGFLEQNPDFSMCFTEIEVVNEIGSSTSRPQPAYEKDVYTIEDIIVSPVNIAPTATLVFRSVLPQPMPAFFLESLSADILIQIMVTDKGKAKLLREKTAIYRIHEGGVTKTEMAKAVGELGRFKLYHNLNKYFNYKYDKAFRLKFFHLAQRDLIFGSRDKKGLEKFRHYLKIMPQYLKYSDGINFKEIAYYHMVLFFPFLLPKRKSE